MFGVFGVVVDFVFVDEVFVVIFVGCSSVVVFGDVFGFFGVDVFVFIRFFIFFVVDFVFIGFGFVIG